MNYWMWNPETPTETGMDEMSGDFKGLLLQPLLWKKYDFNVWGFRHIHTGPISSSFACVCDNVQTPKTGATTINTKVVRSNQHINITHDEWTNEFLKKMETKIWSSELV